MATNVKATAASTKTAASAQADTSTANKLLDVAEAETKTRVTRKLVRNNTEKAVNNKLWDHFCDFCSPGEAWKLDFQEFPLNCSEAGGGAILIHG